MTEVKDDLAQEVTRRVDAYIAAWNETDARQLDSLVKQACTEDYRYVDPLADVRGHGGFVQNVVSVQERFPDHRFRRTSGVDIHHDRARFSWDLVGADGTKVVEGIDVAEITGEGKLRVVTGFFGPLPEDAS